TWSVFLEAASARPRASPARASAESAFSAAALILGSSPSNCFWVLCACFSTSLTFAVMGSVCWATYFFVAQPPNSSTTLATIVASMTRFMGIPPFEFELNSRCYSSIALGRAEAGWTLRGATWRGSRATGTIGVKSYCKRVQLTTIVLSVPLDVPRRQLTSKLGNLFFTASYRQPTLAPRLLRCGRRADDAKLVPGSSRRVQHVADLRVLFFSRSEIERTRSLVYQQRGIIRADVG